MDKKTSELGIFFAGNRLRAQAPSPRSKGKSSLHGIL